METIYLIENQNINDEICPICHELLSSDHVHEIKECKHKFHSNCLITWLRTGNVKCPYCNSLPVNYLDDNTFCKDSLSSFKFKTISNYCKRKNANKKIIKNVETIKKLEKDEEELNKLLKNKYKEVGQYKTIQKDMRIIRDKKWKLHRKIIDKKNDLFFSVNIVPYFIKK